MRKDLNAEKIDKAIGANIRHIRRVRGVSQEQLGGILGITYQQIQKYERGQNSISADKLITLARMLQVNVMDFYEGTVESIEIAEFPKITIEALKAFSAIKEEVVQRRLLALMHTLH